ncbi:MAG: hypothetical protein ACOCQ7_02395 [Natronomonas sp.]
MGVAHHGRLLIAVEQPVVNVYGGIERSGEQSCLRGKAAHGLGGGIELLDDRVPLEFTQMVAKYLGTRTLPIGVEAGMIASGDPTRLRAAIGEVIGDPTVGE